MRRFIRDLLEFRARPIRRPLGSHAGFLVVEIDDRKPPCVVCGGSVPRGRHYTCSNRCQIKENLRVKGLLKRRREAQIPKIPMSRKVGIALRGLFGGDL